MLLKKDFDLSELTLENIGIWPYPVKVLMCVLAYIMILLAGYYFDISDMGTTLDASNQKESQLRAEFESKQSQSASLEAYKLQLKEIKRSFGNLLRQLPSKTEVPGLLEDISKAGIASGLEFRSFDPGLEVHHDFYAELPITIEVVGTYNQLGEFVSRIAALDRIVTLHDFQIKKLENKTTPTPNAKPSSDNKAIPSNMLSMQMTAKTYRYMDEIEVKESEKKHAK